MCSKFVITGDVLNATGQQLLPYIYLTSHSGASWPTLTDWKREVCVTRGPSTSCYLVKVHDLLTVLPSEIDRMTSELSESMADLSISPHGIVDCPCRTHQAGGTSNWNIVPSKRCR